MATISELKELAIHAVNGTAPAEFTAENVQDALRDSLKELAGSVNQFQKNRYDIYELLIAAADEYLPKRVIESFGSFADIMIVGQGQKAVFKTRQGKLRAKKFLTQVGVSGVYETFRLDRKDVEIPAHAIGGGATLDFERYLDGKEELTDLMEILNEGLADGVFGEVQKALIAAFANMPALNKATVNSFDASTMVKLINSVKAYGEGAVIFACPEFIAAMGPDVIQPTYGNVVGTLVVMPNAADVNDIHTTGRIHIFRGNPIVEIPQSYTDETNKRTIANPQYAYILPTGKEKVVKLVLEGATQINDFKNRDNSMEIYAYKKVGTGILTYHNWAIYKNEGIADTTSTDRQ